MTIPGYFLAALLVAVAAYLFRGYLFPSQRAVTTLRMFTPAELALSGSGAEEGPLLLAIAGEVFDVTRGQRFYGKNGSYKFFVGRDASRAFVLGGFTPEGLNDDVEDFTPKECNGLYSWVDFFRKHAKYAHVGYLEGRFYTSQGEPTERLQRLVACHEEYERGAPERDRAERDKQCTFEYVAGRSRVGCTNLDFVPRRASFMTATGLKEECFCLERESALERRDLQLYADCDDRASFCSLPPPTTATASSEGSDIFVENIATAAPDTTVDTASVSIMTFADKDTATAQH